MTYRSDGQVTPLRPLHQEISKALFAEIPGEFFTAVEIGHFAHNPTELFHNLCDALAPSIGVIFVRTLNAKGSQ